MMLLLRYAPLAMGLFLVALAVGIWPSGGSDERLRFMGIVCVILLLTVSVALLRFGYRFSRQQKEQRTGSLLRAKMVIGLISILLIPTMGMQFFASQMVDKGLSVWFDVRVDALLDRSLSLAQGFYSRVEGESKHSMALYQQDAELLAAMQAPIDFVRLNRRLGEIRRQTVWEHLQLYDQAHQLIADIHSGSLGLMRSMPLDEQAELALSLGMPVSDIRDDVVIVYGSLHRGKDVLGLLRAELRIPEDIAASSRAIEKDFHSYRLLERQRGSIQYFFAYALLMFTLLVVIAASFAAIFFSRRLTAPISHLAKALQKVREGHFDTFIPVAPQDELGSLVYAFNRMSQKLNENITTLNQAQADLQQALGHSQERQQILETLLSNLESGVLLLDHAGRIRLLNLSLRHLLDLHKEWVLSASVHALWTVELEPLAMFFQELQKQDRHLQQELQLTLQGQQRYFLVRGVRLYDQEHQQAYLLVLDDMSFLIEAQKTRAWAEVAQRLAHEIKNPLTPIKLSAERLQRRFRHLADDPKVFDTCTQAIITQVERLQRLISDFSTLARMPKPRVEKVYLRDLLAHIQSLYAPYPQCVIEPVDASLLAYCDADQIRQVLINLLDNALSALTETSGQLLLRCELADEWSEIHVIDEGPGMSDVVAKQIFEPYFSTKASGSGLGLAIARRIAEDHGGALLLLSAAQPTHFCLRLPNTDLAVEDGA